MLQPGKLFFGDELAELSNVSRVYAGFLNQALIMDEIQQTLFSGSARHASQQARSEYARGFATRLLGILESVRSV